MINDSPRQMVRRAVTVIRASPSHHQLFSLFSQWLRTTATCVDVHLCLPVYGKFKHGIELVLHLVLLF